MRRSRISRQRGDNNIGCVLWMLALIVGIMIAWKAVPVKMASANMKDFMIEQAKFAANRKPDVIRKALIKKAALLDLPVDKRDIKVEKPGDFIKMSVEYTVPLEFPGYTYEWHFHHKVDRSIFIF
ncbi:MAG: hypothetical protein K0U98_21165 [Deltaproteobacteria bacterium]|nr:hypothetical protein [Deltaproteobacteria bacterium]